MVKAKRLLTHNIHAMFPLLLSSSWSLRPHPMSGVGLP